MSEAQQKTTKASVIFFRSFRLRTNYSQVGNPETGWIFQAITQHTIKTDVGNPYQTNRQNGGLWQQITEQRTSTGQHVRMHQVVHPCTDARSENISKKGQVRHQKKQCKKPPAGIQLLIQNDGYPEDQKPL